MKKFPRLLAGEANGTAKLSWEIVRAMRELHKNGVPQRRIAKKYNVVPTTINNIVHNRSWIE